MNLEGDTAQGVHGFLAHNVVLSDVLDVDDEWAWRSDVVGMSDE